MFEVFVRIEDEDGVWVTPGAFLGAAERHQLTAKLDLEVLHAVLGQLQTNASLIENYACACINLSAASFSSEGFAGELLQILAMSGVPAHRICFEIDEADALSHKAALRRFIDALRPAGIRFSLDRYRAIGGLYELRAVPIDFVKLHDSLLQCLDPGLKDEIGLKHLHWATDIAAAMNIVTIATGIENEAMLGPLKSVGVRYAQGLALNKLGPLLLA
jgi:EAL domain-containing protein (putative c-di-GMP-specific phosphodiesterase class I)